ncbi:unnamed protein product [Protopolystoma xenopodis]|uniref:Uncharacterized protein n=1 Tax=Protopolystoma xenopodis TaxID=117903 RepID=A0A448X0W6_9PLAT|nr:unnamed protein product [Protopolystoma xenopodis]
MLSEMGGAKRMISSTAFRLSAALERASKRHNAPSASVALQSPSDPPFDLHTDDPTIATVKEEEQKVQSDCSLKQKNVGPDEEGHLDFRALRVNRVAKHCSSIRQRPENTASIFVNYPHIEAKRFVLLKQPLAGLSDSTNSDYPPSQKDESRLVLNFYLRGSISKQAYCRGI